MVKTLIHNILVNGFLFIKPFLLKKWPIRKHNFWLDAIFRTNFQSANDMKIFIVLPESPLKVRKIAIYCFLIDIIFSSTCLNHLKL